MRVTYLPVLFLFALLTAQANVDGAETGYFQGKTVTLQVGAPAGGRQVALRGR